MNVSGDEICSGNTKQLDSVNTKQHFPAEQNLRNALGTFYKKKKK